MITLLVDCVGVVCLSRDETLVKLAQVGSFVLESFFVVDRFIIR